MMKRICIGIYLLAFCISNVFGQTFQKYYYSGYNNEARTTFCSTNFGYLLGDYTILATDFNGTKLWMKDIPDPQFSNSYYSFIPFTTGGYLGLGGATLTRFDSTLSIIWHKRLTLFGCSNFQMYFLNNSDLIIVGQLNITGVNGGVCVSFCDTSGSVSSSKIVKTPFLISYESMEPTPDKGFIVSGEVGSSSVWGNNLRIGLIKFDSTGTIQWAKQYYDSLSTNYNHFPYKVTHTSDGGYVVCGIKNLTRFLMKTDSAGTVLWTKEYNAEVDGSAVWVEQTTDGGFIMTGNMTGVDSSYLQQTCILLKTDNSGNLQWAREIGGYAEVWAGCVRQVSDGGYVISGRRPAGLGTQGYMLMKTDSMGFIGCQEGIPNVTVSNLDYFGFTLPVSDSAITYNYLPRAYTLNLIGTEHNVCTVTGLDEAMNPSMEFLLSPNPGNGDFEVKLPTEMKLPATLQIIDCMGRLIWMEQLVTKEDYHHLSLRNHISSGFYSCRLIQQRDVRTYRFIVQ